MSNFTTRPRITAPVWRSTPVPQQNIGADLIQEARTVERQKVLNEVRDAIEGISTSGHGGYGDTYDYRNGLASFQKAALDRIRNLGADQ